MMIALKLGLTVVAVGFWLGTQKLLGLRKEKFDDVIGDYVLVHTEKWNAKLNASPKIANAFLIASSLLIDLLGVYLILQTLFGSTLRPLLGLIMLFTLRQLNQFNTVLPTPKGMIWRDPGVPSLFVTYGVSNDLFFSGHTALAVFGAIEMAHLGGVFTAIAVVIALFEIVTVLLLRAHWTMDVFTGIIAALWTNEIVTRYAPVLDQHLLRWLGQ